MKTNQPYVVGIGAANVDFCAKSIRPVVRFDSNPGQVTVTAGGVTRNIMENLARMRVPSKMVSVMGTDAFSDVIRRDSEAAGMDMSHMLVVEGAGASCYIDVIDSDGNMVVAVSDMRIMQNMTVEYLESKRALFENAAIVVMDGCLPIHILNSLVFDICRGKPIFVDPVSRAYARPVREIMHGCHTIKPNIYELEILAGRTIETDADIEAACEQILQRGTQRIVVSLGGRGCYYADADGKRFYRSLHKFDTVENVTGAGDAFMAGLAYGFMHELSAEETADFALGASIVALSSLDTINPDMSPDLVKEIVEKYATES